MNIFLEKLDFSNENLLKKIFEWRNEKITRENSIHTNIITEEIFLKIINSFKNSIIKPYIIVFKNIINNKNECINIGYISFSENDNKTFIGINIDKEYRGKGISKIAIKNILEIIKKEYKTVDNIYAKIKSTNISSLKLFSKYFNFIKNEDEYKIFVFNLYE